MSSLSQHVSVMPEEALDWLNPQPGQTIVDGTLGGGGHTKLLAQRVGPQGAVISLDRDPDALARAENALRGMPVILVHTDFSDLPETLEQLNLPPVDGVLLDLGLSSDQLADPARGFSFDSDGPLDLRFDPEQGEPAERLVNRMRPESLADLIYAYGEERHSRRIARAIAERRKSRPIESARDLAEIVRRCVPRPRSGERIDAATRTFQALRIAVNQELRSLETVLKRLPVCVKPGGRVVVISFHSLEDRLVKQAFRDNPGYDVLTRRPVRPGDEETRQNPRSRSAKLRAAEIASAASRI